MVGRADKGRMCLQVPVTFIYGDADWMEPAAGQRVARAVLQHRGRLSSTDCEVHSLTCPRMIKGFHRLLPAVTGEY